MQIGLGVTTSAIRNLYTQGALTRTGYTTDLAVAGDGFFVVFDQPALAVDSAIAIQRALDEHRRRTGFAPSVRIGEMSTSWKSG